MRHVKNISTDQAPLRFSLAPWQYAALNSGAIHTGFFAGIGAGKTFTGAHYAIQMFDFFPDVTGFIGANSYDQLTQATLRELFYWLEHYGWQFVVDRMPPKEWGLPLNKFKKWNNILTVKNPRNGKASIAFIRTMSEPDSMRGIEISWYWLDETRDTTQYAHDVLLGRMRESDVVRGIITSTTNGEDWAFERFVKNADGRIYASLHVETKDAVDYGILTHQYYETLMRSYSPLMAEQELMARHVNVYGGRAYYAASSRNARHIAPWGDTVPDESRPLIIGCDFNFSPAPCIWMVGQTGPNDMDPSDGIPYWEKLHWFGEVCMMEASSPEMATRLASQFGVDFHYRIFGDASGSRGTTSNAGVNDYQQIAIALSDLGVSHQIDWVHGNPDDSKANPRVKNRVEHMNSYLCNAASEVRMTYNPDKCPNFDADLRRVGWKKQTGNMTGMGKLDDGGDNKRTHASDGGGYALMKLFPPRRQARLVESLPSPLLAEINI